MGAAVMNEAYRGKEMSIFKAWLPYLVVAFLLLLSRIWTPLKELLNEPALSLNFDNLFGTTVSTSVQPLYLPGTMFLIAVGAAVLIQKIDGQSGRIALKRSFKTVAGAAFALGFAVPMVRIFINSGINVSGFESMPMILARGTADLVQGAWPFFAPTIGALGAFIAGSNTVSNMMFAFFFSLILFLLQAVGGAAGNMVCVHNVVAACATVGLLGVEGLMVRKVLLPLGYYLLAAGLLGLLGVYL